jgi:hypothetical protein
MENPKPATKSLNANAFIKTFCTLGFIFYSVFLVVGVIIGFYAFIFGLFGSILVEALSPFNLGIDLDMLLVLPFLNVVAFYALSLVGLIMLLRSKFRGFYIFVITQFIGIILLIYLIYIFVAFWLIGAIFIIMFFFFAGMFCTQIGKYR